MEIKYPAAAYIVLRALQDTATFKLSYRFINRDPPVRKEAPEGSGGY